MKKRIACLALALIMLLLSVPVFALSSFAADAQTEAVAQIEEYIAKVEALTPATDYQRSVKGKMLVYYSNLKENISTLTADELQKAVEDLDNYYDYNYEDYRYGEVANTSFVMTFGIMSDLHIDNNNNRVSIVNSALAFMKESANFKAAFFTGDLSDNGISPTNDANTDFDNYCDFVDEARASYYDEDGNLIPIINILGNHDVRGPYKENYPTGSYKLAMELYMEREGLTYRNFDMWIDGYHFIMINPSKYHKDDCELTTEDVLWLEEKLSENEDGRPIFVMIHQPTYRIHTPADSPYTFTELMARHPSACIMAGHTHYGFGENIITQEGRGNYIGIPAIVSNTGKYTTSSFYIAEVYEGGVIYRAYTRSGSSWIPVPEGDVIVRAENYGRDDIFSAGTYPTDTISGATAEVKASNAPGGKTLVLSGEGNVVLDIPAKGLASEYAAYAVYVESASPVTLVFHRFAPTAGTTYYAFDGTKLTEKTVDANGAIEATGWVILPKECFAGNVHPTDNREMTVKLTAGQSVSLSLVTYGYSIDEIAEDLKTVTYTFLDENGNVLSSGNAPYGTAVTAPAIPEKAEDVYNTYAAAGWDFDGDGKADTLPTAFTDDVVAVATYTATTRQYTYAFYAADGTTVLNERTGNAGSRIIESSVTNLFGWDLNGDGIAEDLPEKLDRDFRAVAIIADSSKVTFTFKNASGYRYVYGQVSAGAAVTVPVVESGIPGCYFLGWDITGDGKADKVGEQITVDKNLTATAVFYDTNNYTEIWTGNKTSTKLESNVQSGVTVLTGEEVAFENAPGGTAYKVTWDGTEQTINTYFILNLPYDHDNPTVPVGFAFWISVPDSDSGYNFGLFKNWLNALTGAPIYYLSSDGTLKSDTAWRHKSLPANFEGWVIVPQKTFESIPTATENDYIRFAFSKSEGNPKVPQSTTYFGSALTYSCTTEEMIAQLRNSFCLFKDIDGTVLGCGTQDTGITLPENVTRPDDEGYTYEFIGWDINGDGMADDLTTLPVGSFTAVATYKMTPKQYTYRFVDTNGTVLLEKTAEYGSLVLPPFRMAMNYEDEHYSYTRSYTNYTEGMTLSGNTDYIVALDATPKQTYTVEFYLDGVLLEKQELGYGAVIVPPTLPEREGVAGRWNGYTEGMTVTSNVRFDATYGGGCGGCGASVGDVGFIFAALLLLACGAFFSRRRVRR